MTTPVHQKIVLVVEDNPDDFFAVKRGFTQAGMNNPIVHCASGEDALDYLHRRGAHAGVSGEQPGLILLDINLPGINGVEVLQKLKDNPALRNTPVVMLTTSTDDRDVELAYSLGANSYIHKPVDYESLIHAIRQLKDYWFGVVQLPKS